MDWYPNEDAILHLLDGILPAIRREVPEASLTIVGRNPSARLRAAAAAAGVQVTGTVEDVRPYVAEAAVYVEPLRTGGGTRLKLFEGLAMAKAVVSTRAGHQVICVDVNADKVAMLNGGRSPIVEPGLGELLADVVGRGRLGATTSCAAAVAQSDLGLISVGTPGRPNGQLDVAAIGAVAREIGLALTARAMPFPVVLRSTVLPGPKVGIFVHVLSGAAGSDSGGTHCN